MPTSPSDTPADTVHDTLLVTVTGPDRPGVTSALFAALEPTGAHVLDVEQVVVGGVLTLSVLTTHGDAVRATVAGLDLEGLEIRCTAPQEPVVDRPRRLHVTLLARRCCPRRWPA